MPFKKITKQILIEKSIELFNKRGYWGVSIKDIAEHAGVAKASVYHYFESKDGLAAACVEFSFVFISAGFIANNPYLLLFYLELTEEESPLTCNMIKKYSKTINGYLKENISWWMEGL